MTGLELVAIIGVIIIGFLFVETVFKTIKAWLKFVIIAGAAFLAYTYGFPNVF